MKFLDFELKRFSSFAIAQVSILEINQLKWNTNQKVSLKHQFNWSIVINWSIMIYNLNIVLDTKSQNHVIWQMEPEKNRKLGSIQILF